MEWFGALTLAEARERAEEAMWEATVAMSRLADAVDELPVSWSAVQLPGLPAVSLAFLAEHASAELERLCEAVGNA